MSHRADIQRTLQDAVANRAAAGVVGVAVTRDGVLHAGAAGRRSLDEPASMQLDTLFWVASMTKLVTSVAALQLVEQGLLDLHAPIGTVLPRLAAPQVLEGFDAQGNPMLRPARRPVTLHHLLTHTAGLSYEFWDKQLIRFQERTGMPSIRTGRLAALETPLVFDPGENWFYSTATDWVGLAVEAASGVPLETYFSTRIFAPLALRDIRFGPPEQEPDRVAAMHRRLPDGGLEAIAFTPRVEPEFHSGGGGLYATGADYGRFLRMLLAGGTLDGARVLRPETVTLMGQNQIGGLQTVDLIATNPAISNDVTFYAAAGPKWGLASLVDMRPSAHGRSVGTLSWAGLANTYFWIDPIRGLAGLFLTQLLPFADEAVLAANRAFEGACYAALREAT